MRLQDLAIITGIPIDTDKVLLEKFKAHDRVVFNPKTNLYSYKVRSLRRLVREARLMRATHQA